MATQLSSETLSQAKIATTINTDSKLIVNINNVNYKIEIILHKKGQSKEDGYMINSSFLNSIIFVDSLFEVFPKLIINFEDKESSSLPYHFSYDSEDRAFVYLSRIQENDQNPTYPLVDDDFVIVNNSHEQIDNSNDNSKFFNIQLLLMPTAWFDLINLSPQWTTGFDEKYKQKSGKEVGKCIKEILEMAGCVTDNPIFDFGKSKINYTSLMGESALNTIEAIFPYFLPSDDSTPGIFKYNPVTHKFVLKSIKSFFDHKNLDDDIKSYPTVPLKKPDSSGKVSFTSMLGTTLETILNGITNKPKSADITHGITHNIKSIDETVTKTLRISRHKGTFIIDPREFDLNETIKQIKKNFKDSDVNFGQDVNTLVKKDEVINRVTSFTPHYRENERAALNKQAMSFLLKSSNFSAAFPWFGGEIQPGRKFAVKIALGATTEELRKKTGTYMIISTQQMLDIRQNNVETTVLGLNILKSIQGTYHI